MVEKTSNHDSTEYDVKSSGLALADAVAVVQALGAAMDASFICEAVDEFGKPLSLNDPNAYCIIARYPNGVSFFWTAEFGNRINIHCPNEEVFRSLTTQFTVPAISP